MYICENMVSSMRFLINCQRFSKLLLLVDHFVNSFISKHLVASETHWHLNWYISTEVTVVNKIEADD